MLDNFRQKILYGLNIQTPGLRMLVLYFGHVGVQMRAVRLNNWFSVLNFMWNITIDLLLFYAYLVLDPFQLASLETRCEITKPMFGYLVQIIDRYIYPGIYLINLIFAYFYGSKLIHLLDSDCLHRFYVQGNRWKIIYVGFISSHFLFFFMFYSDKINTQGLSQWPRWDEILRYGCMYACLYQYWACAIVHYAQFAIFNLLVKIEKKLHPNMPSLEQYRMMEEIRTLALINHQLNQLISLPMAVFILLSTFNIVMFVCMALLCQPVIGLLLHALVTALYLGYLIVLNDRVLCMLRRIVVSFRLFCDNDQNSRQLFQMTKYNKTIWGFALTNRTNAYFKESSVSRRIRCNQIDVYYKHFTIQIFDLGKLNIQFILSATMFILSYVVLITQTN